MAKKDHGNCVARRTRKCKHAVVSDAVVPDVVTETMIRSLRRWAPKYDEITTYLTAASSILTLAFYPELRDMYLWAWSSWREKHVLPFLVGGTAVAILGMAACVGSVLTRERNSLGKKVIMGSFTMGACGVAAIAAVVENLPQKVGIGWVFPVLNILAGLLLLYQMMLATADSVSDRQTGPVEVLVATAGLIAVFAASRWWCALGWGMTLSVCLTYSDLAGVVAARMRPNNQPAS